MGMHNIAPECMNIQISDVLKEAYTKWCDNNKRKPLYYVTHPNDWFDLNVKIQDEMNILAKEQIMAIFSTPVLVHEMVVIGSAGFVG